MDKRQQNTLAVIVLFGLVSHFYFGYVLWLRVKGVNIFAVSLYFCMDLLGFTCYLIATKSNLLKATGAFGMAMGSFLMYIEFHDPRNWEERDGVLMAMIFINVLFILIFTWYLKPKKCKNEI